MFTLSNILSFFRIPLAFVFLIQNSMFRFIAITLAMVTDSIDGYIARKKNNVTKFGAILDPIADKFFVYFALARLSFEGVLQPWQALSMMSRDLALICFAILALSMQKSFVIKSFKIGKFFTALQFLCLILLVFNIILPSFVFYGFFVLGILSLLELCLTISDRLG